MYCNIFCSHAANLICRSKDNLSSVLVLHFYLLYLRANHFLFTPLEGDNRRCKYYNNYIFDLSCMQKFLKLNKFDNFNLIIIKLFPLQSMIWVFFLLPFAFALFSTCWAVCSFWCRSRHRGEGTTRRTSNSRNNAESAELIDQRFMVIMFMKRISFLIRRSGGIIVFLRSCLVHVTRAKVFPPAETHQLACVHFR